MLLYYAQLRKRKKAYIGRFRKMTTMKKPSLFGIVHSNRDFTTKESWGKNQFNSAFPAALTAFIHSKGLDCKYLVLSKKLDINHKFLSVQKFFGQKPTSKDLFYAFETQYSPYQQLVVGTLPRVDLVTQSRKNGNCLAPIEIKLTALPDNTTCNLEESQYGSEIVIRPDTIVYLACSIASKFSKNRAVLKNIFGKKYSKIKDWSEGVNVQPLLPQMIEDINKVCLSIEQKQNPLILQPIWKTIGKSPRLAQNCLDVFVWSDLAFTRLFIDSTNSEVIRGKTKISRQSRTVVWLFKMLYDFAKNGQIHHELVIDSLSYNTKNDKAFALSGKVTHKYMKSKELLSPRITKQEIKDIILGEGHNMLSPERRFDAIIFNSPELFD